VRGEQILDGQEFRRLIADIQEDSSKACASLNGTLQKAILNRSSNAPAHGEIPNEAALNTRPDLDQVPARVFPL
jgi:hypothetical protein